MLTSTQWQGQEYKQPVTMKIAMGGAVMTLMREPILEAY